MEQNGTCTAPAERIITVCGAPLSDFDLYLYFPDTVQFKKLSKRLLFPKLELPFSKVVGKEKKVNLIQDDSYNEKKISEHEILFGTNFKRPGMPERDLTKSFYGVTADGTVYFSSPSPILYGYLWHLFLEEFAGTSGVENESCAIRECYREIPKFDISRLEAQGYRKVFEDTFEEKELDPEIWKHRGVGGSDGRYTTESQSTLEDGKLVIRGQYKADGERGEGWYTGQVSLRKWYRYGYFESKVRCSYMPGRQAADFWSAFWIQAPSPYDPDQSQGGIGPGGSEIDIMENFGPDCTTSCIWISGWEGERDLSGEVCEVHNLGNSYPDEYHVFSLLWTEDYYEMYVDGMLTDHTSFGYGTSRVNEEVIFSLCMPGNVDLDHDTVRTMYADYLRIWQKPEQ